MKQDRQPDNVMQSNKGGGRKQEEKGKCRTEEILKNM